ncbi:MAG: dihydropteroate synthase [Bacteroides sp.]|nr:dihydropteroate synthase [Prevotella sp.]MCM1407347.1 dihydropteroate synthase [Treponema brennaborense]MCM1469837.1 dihydropteroate synthase [Bacteroides sp.]
MKKSELPPLRFADRTISSELPAFVMGIINCTPDSFYAESRHAVSAGASVQKTAEFALSMIEEGADIIDVGGESSRPGALYISAAEEADRILPVIEEIRKYSDCPISVDTRKKSVMEAACNAGADMLNDISALEDDPELASFAAQKKIPVILMHKRGNPADMQLHGQYADPAGEVSAYLAGRAAYAVSAGIEPEKILYDAGIGFGKNLSANIVLIRSGAAVAENAARDLHCPRPHVVAALSRKTCIGEMTGKPAEKRLAGTLAANLVSVLAGATILRVHDVAETVDMLKVLAYINAAGSK